jgi:hypothetical protein
LVHALAECTKAFSEPYSPQLYVALSSLLMLSHRLDFNRLHLKDMSSGAVRCLLGTAAVKDEYVLDLVNAISYNLYHPTDKYEYRENADSATFFAPIVRALTRAHLQPGSNGRMHAETRGKL